MACCAQKSVEVIIVAKLEDITVGSNVKGIINNEIVSIIAVSWYGNSTIEITYKDSKGQTGIVFSLLWRGKL